jgi:hypothetical protein
MLTGRTSPAPRSVITGPGVAVGDVATPDDATLTATLTIDPARRSARPSRGSSS